ncbi:MAG: (2Fe-2S)-binding protein [Gammaproteobacteria bacterium]|nr:(2Fe-2S)-binding protein [Gammaproteobacteria bacterium]
MFVCICLGVTDQEISNAIEEGHDSVYAINRELGAAGCCGSCMPTIEAMLDTHKGKSQSSEELPYYAAAAG